MKKTPYILLDDQVNGRTRYYQSLVDVIRIYALDKVLSGFERMEAYKQKGYYLAGYIAYEAGHAFEPKLKDLCEKTSETPLIEMGVFKSYRAVPDGFFDACERAPEIKLKPRWSEADYLERFDQVQTYIRAGDVYQINLTFPLEGYYTGSARSIYDCLRRRQPGEFGAIISLSDQQFISFSPELFYQITDTQIDLRPMKGTAKRLDDPQDDKTLKQSLQRDPKNRAENLMIVDLLRNDVSRIAEVGSVHVPQLFHIETYPTLHQMTSQIRATLPKDTKIEAVFRALFPCGSITGAPKIRAMEIIHALEDRPRGAYCGAIGYIDPDGETCFNVAIRTMTLKDSLACYNVGSGVVLDSVGTDEYAECLLKSHVISPPPLNETLPDLIETLRWSAEQGYVRLSRHLSRLMQSAVALGYEFDSQALLDALESQTFDQDQRIRIALSAFGTFNIHATNFKSLPSPLKLSLSQHALTPTVQRFDHKTSARTFYDGERARISAITGCDEVLFFNRVGELCEGSFNSVYLKIDDILLTPLLSSGLLPSVLREELLENGQAVARVLTIEDINKAETIYVGNSLRGMMEARLLSVKKY